MANNLITLTSWLAGDFSNREQAWAAPAFFAHIRLCMRPLPWHVFEGYGLYSEQADDYDWAHPYRVVVLHLVEQADSGIIECRNYALKDVAAYYGACREPDRARLHALNLDQMEAMPGCTFLFRREDDHFLGRVKPGKGCRVRRRGQDTYLDGEAKVSAEYYESIDRGRDLETDEQVWGSVSGPFHFAKQVDFAHEVTALP
ncbi:chromophore lyase CpcT/CpeT [Gloeobacter kilaueensis]|uniref:Chromophore lyase CpcT/CpeT n=1 Tax=Gloeobacter kilaueensis (strain ATCC BAA-2537 / CCAP 1431/1 / ULC 316 / JS1) TaxID=1183438 RepID=U5QNR4_GLOK1|nr:chromophore lyase CpcT/CpeT [Gloeobacter kilaueensis]AGY60523.1 hypothetical protein GKIL_4277 [Gloeobacter kilaueensis JS1]